MSILFTAASNQGLTIAGTLNQTQNKAGNTLMGWAYAASFANTENYIVGFTINTSSSSARHILSARSSGVWRTTTRRLDADSSTILDSAAGTATTGSWFHIASVASWTGQSLIIYVNGVASNSTAPAAWTANTSNTTATNGGVGIRGDSSTSSDWDGWLDDVRVYDRALSADEIATIYAARGTDRILDNLVNRWLLNGPEGGTVTAGAGAGVIDIMGNNNLTQSNDPVYGISSAVSWRA